MTVTLRDIAQGLSRAEFFVHVLSDPDQHVMYYRLQPGSPSVLRQSSCAIEFFDSELEHIDWCMPMNTDLAYVLTWVMASLEPHPSLFEGAATKGEP